MAANLSVTAYWARFFIKYGIAFIIFVVLARFFLTVGINIYHHFSPPPPPKPTVSYGKLPALNFPDQTLEKKFNYVLELPEGDLPKAPDSLPVWVIPKKSAFLGALDEARKIADGLGFNKNEESLSPVIYRWKDQRDEATLDMNIITQAFSINSNLWQDKDLLSLRAITQGAATGEVNSFLSKSNLFPKDFTDGKTLTTLIKNENGNLTLAESLSAANFIRIDLFRQKYNDFPVVTTKPSEGNVWFLVSSTTDPSRSIIAGEYHYFPIDSSQSSTYPVKSAQSAWQELQEGKGAIVSPTGKDKIIIRRVYLAYYDPSDYEPFFQPVFVFEGDDSFVGYVPAVSSTYYGQ